MNQSSESLHQELDYFLLLKPLKLEMLLKHFNTLKMFVTIFET